MAQIRVGRTPLFKSIDLSGRYNAVVHVKDESRNPFGTFKDRRCAALLEHNQGKKELIFVHITSGNSGYSLGMLAADEEMRAGRNVKVVNVVGTDISPVVKAKLETCSIVHQMELTNHIVNRDELIAIARRLTHYTGPEENILTVEDFGLANGYGKIIDEIAVSGVKPKYIYCPMGEGELATELVKRALEVWPERTPIIAGITISQNALVDTEDFIKRLRKSIADKLVNGYSKFKAFIQRYREQGSLNTCAISEALIAREYRYLNDIGIACEPSAAAAFAGARECKFWAEPDDQIVIINTGKGIYDKKAVDRFQHTRLIRWLKYAAVGLASAATMALAIWGYVYLYQKAYNLFVKGLYEKAELYADVNRDGHVDYDETLEVCTTIPEKKCEVGPHQIANSIYDKRDFTLEEIAYYVKHQEFLSWNDYTSRRILSDMQVAWEKGWFRIDGLEIKWTELPKQNTSGITGGGIGDFCKTHHTSFCP